MVTLPGILASRSSSVEANHQWEHLAFRSLDAVVHEVVKSWIRNRRAICVLVEQ